MSLCSTETSAKIKMPQYRVRYMKPEDVPSVLEIWADNDLHEGTYSINSFMAQDPEGFVVAVEIEDVDEESTCEGTSKRNAGVQVLVTDSEQRCSYSFDQSNSLKTSKIVEKRILGMCAGLFVHPTIAFIGLYGVLPELHGHGIGSKMWKRMMEHVGSLNCGLYAVKEHLSMYRDRAGFSFPDDRLLFIYESSEENPIQIQLLVSSVRGIKIMPITSESFQRVIEFDSNVHGYNRRKLLPHVFTEPGSASFFALDEEDDEVQGFGCIRTNNIGKAMIGPLYANNDAVAELIMKNLFDSLSEPLSKGLLYMTLDSNPGGERIANKLGLIKHEELPRFFRHQPYLDAKWNNVYCIHSPNFSLL